LEEVVASILMEPRRQSTPRSTWPHVCPSLEPPITASLLQVGGSRHAVELLDPAVLGTVTPAKASSRPSGGGGPSEWPAAPPASCFGLELVDHLFVLDLHVLALLVPSISSLIAPQVL